MKAKSAGHHRRWVLRLFEWGVLACIVALLIGLFLNRVGQARAMIEQQNFLTTVRTLQAAVTLQSVIHPQEAIPGGNPVTAHQQQFGIVPAGYIGELASPDPASVAGGSWYFDRKERRLVYRVSSTDYFRCRLRGPPRIRLQVVRQAGTETLTVQLLDDGQWRVTEENSPT